ncbi:MAG: spore coat associated protein CotJA [Tyzzerella sp.]|nr:spore coat associated protein CotJA [Tyzzerella sp.]
MPNYRNNAMPYTNYRQTQMVTPVVRRDTSDDMSLAMAYVPWQVWRNLYDAEKGFHCGTIFQELNMPFLGKGGMKR